MYSKAFFCGCWKWVGLSNLNRTKRQGHIRLKLQINLNRIHFYRTFTIPLMLNRNGSRRQILFTFEMLATPLFSFRCVRFDRANSIGYFEWDRRCVWVFRSTSLFKFADKKNADATWKWDFSLQFTMLHGNSRANFMCCGHYDAALTVSEENLGPM